VTTLSPSPPVVLDHHVHHRPELARTVRNASRNASPLVGSFQPPSRICQFCGNEYEGGSRRRSYCDAVCRQAAFRARRQQPVIPAPPRRAHRLDVLYECAACGERLVNEQRCETCCRFAKRLGVAVTCPSCDEPLLLSELLEQLQ
jgi:hypothetical protein